MNTGLRDLMTEYLGSTGELMLYFDMMDTGEVTGAGFVRNTGPASTVGSYTGYIGDTKSIDTFIIGDKEGGDLTHSRVEFGPFDNGFLQAGEYETDATFLFSFTKIDPEDGILFGCLDQDQFDNGSEIKTYGKGFNIGVNDRNKLFLQGIDSNEGPWIATADKLELATKNICSVGIRPYSVTFTHYNLSANKAYSETVSTNVKIENPDSSYYLGDSNSYYKEAGFSGYVDEFAILSGNFEPSILKSLASGFVATGESFSGDSRVQTVVTGYENVIVRETGYTGYLATPTGTRKIDTTGIFVQTTINNVSIGLNEGDRFDTGFTLANGEHYKEEIGFLVKDDLYGTTGNDPHATKGLKDTSLTVEGSEVTLTTVATETGEYVLYGLTPLTGFTGPSGVERTPLTKEVVIDGETSQIYNFKEGVIEDYRHDYLYYLSER